jgi:hypothetical protein
VTPFNPEPTGNFILDAIFRRLVTTLDSLRELVTNEHLVFAELGTTPVQVFHGMGALPRSIEVVGLDAGEVVFESPLVNASRKTFVMMQATGPCSATLRFT